MNDAFKAVAQSVKALNKKGAGLFGLVGAFVLSIMPENGFDPGHDLKPVFSNEEKLATVELKVSFGKDAPSTYRVVKGLFINCATAGIKLTENGKLRGKSDLEAELALGKVPKSEIDKFKSTIATAMAIADKLPAHDRLMAAALVQELLKSTANGLALAA